MIFKPELIEKILAGEKTVTRRPVKYDPAGEPLPCRYEPGRDYALQPGRGKKAVGRIRVLDVRREPLAEVDTADARREGFYGGPEFAAYWSKLYGSYDPTELVDRIEFELLPGGQS